MGDAGSTKREFSSMRRVGDGLCWSIPVETSLHGVLLLSLGKAC